MSRSRTSRSGVATAARTVGMLALLQLAAPIDAALTGAAWLAPSGRARGEGPPGAELRTVLVSGGKMTKALELARCFHDAGHRVVMVETARYRLTAHRFSRAVDAFHVVPDPTSPAYADALLRVVKEEGVDVYVPVCSPVASLADARAKELLAGHCEVVHLDADRLGEVDDKAAFAARARSLGLPVPDTHRITDPQQVLDFDFTAAATAEGRTPRPYILKSIAYDPVHRLDLTPLPRPTAAETAAFVRALPITPDNPWILQEYVVGEEFCTHGTVRDGRLTVWICCASSASQLNYAMLDRPDIRAWVERFVAAHGTGEGAAQGEGRTDTGQLSFDLIVDAEGVVFGIECNPRTHSAITLLRGHPELAAAYLGDRPADAPAVAPAVDARPTYWLHHELWQGLRHPRRLPHTLRTLATGRDAVLDRTDPLPFFLLYHLHLPSLLWQALKDGRPWVKIDVNIGKLVEPGGD